MWYCSPYRCSHADHCQRYWFVFMQKYEPVVLTHFGLGPEICANNDVALTAPNHYLNQYWLIIDEIFWHSHERNFTWNVTDNYPWYVFENDNSWHSAQLLIYRYPNPLHIDMYLLKSQTWEQDSLKSQDDVHRLSAGAPFVGDNDIAILSIIARRYNANHCHPYDNCVEYIRILFINVCYKFRLPTFVIMFEYIYQTVSRVGCY